MSRLTFTFIARRSFHDLTDHYPTRRESLSLSALQALGWHPEDAANFVATQDTTTSQDQ